MCIKEGHTFRFCCWNYSGYSLITDPMLSLKADIHYSPSNKLTYLFSICDLFHTYTFGLLYNRFRCQYGHTGYDPLITNANYFVVWQNGFCLLTKFTNIMECSILRPLCLSWHLLTRSPWLPPWSEVRILLKGHVVLTEGFSKCLLHNTFVWVMYLVYEYLIVLQLVITHSCLCYNWPLYYIWCQSGNLIQNFECSWLLKVCTSINKFYLC